MSRIYFNTRSGVVKRIRIVVVALLFMFSNLLSIGLLPQSYVGAISTVIPAKPAINSPTFKEYIPIGEIYDSVSPRQVTFTPDSDSSVVKSIITIGGEFEGASGYRNVTLPQDVNGNFRSLKDFAPGTVGELKYKTGNLYSIYIRSTTVANADENDATLWSEPSDEGYFFVTASVPPVTAPAMPVLDSPTEGESIPISEIYNSISPRKITFTPDATKPSAKTIISVNGSFENGNGTYWIVKDQATDGNYRNLKDFAPGTAGELKYKIGNSYKIQIRSVIMVDGDEVGSMYTPERSFMVVEGIPPIDAPTAPTNLMPADGSEVKNMFSKFTWSAVAGATSYDVDISLDSDFATLEKTYSNLPGVFSDDEQPFQLRPLKNNQDYYWRVRAKNAGGSSDWTISHFTTNAGQATSPIQISPINGEIVRTTDFRLKWENDPVANSNEVGAGYHFLVEVSKVSDFSTTKQAEIVEFDVDSVPIYGGAEDGVTYYWRVLIFMPTYVSDWSTTDFTVRLDDTPNPDPDPTPNPDPTPDPDPQTPSLPSTAPRSDKKPAVSKSRTLPVTPAVSLAMFTDVGTNMEGRSPISATIPVNQNSDQKTAAVAGDSTVKPFIKDTSGQTKSQEIQRNTRYNWLLVVVVGLLAGWRLLVLAKKRRAEH